MDFIPLEMFSELELSVKRDKPEDISERTPSTKNNPLEESIVTKISAEFSNWQMVFSNAGEMVFEETNLSLRKDAHGIRSAIVFVESCSVGATLHFGQNIAQPYLVVTAPAGYVMSYFNSPFDPGMTQEPQSLQSYIKGFRLYRIADLSIGLDGELTSELQKPTYTYLISRFGEDGAAKIITDLMKIESE